MKIDKNVPIVHKKRGSKGGSKYDAFEVGDSAFIEKSIGLVSGPICVYARKAGKKFTASSVVERGISGTRIWRIA